MIARIPTLRLLLVMLGAVALTAVSIDAFDTVTGSRSTLLGQLISSESGSVCPTGMVEVSTVSSLRCVDIYEVTTGSACPHPAPRTGTETVRNLAANDCQAVSVSGEYPWTYITREQAASMCARNGKRLPTAVEWYAVAVGLSQSADTCVINESQAQSTGSNSECVSPVGAYDMVGNVWEWVSDDVFEGMYHGRTLPGTGYVSQVDSHGVPVATTAQPVPEYQSDYFWSRASGTYAMIRGGFYGSREDAGVYSVHAYTDPNSATPGIGFRCVF